MEIHRPSKERVAIEQKRRLVERLGYFSFSIAGVIAVSLLLGVASYFKLVLFGPEVLLWSAVGALVGFVLLASAFLGYSKLFLTPAAFAEGNQRPTDTEDRVTTNRLIADRPIDDIPSVTEHSTELLMRQPKRPPRSE